MTGHEPELVHQALAAALDEALDDITRFKTASEPNRPVADDHPADAEGLDRPRRRRRASGRGHVALASGAARRTRVPTPNTGSMLEEWLRSYRPDELFDDHGALVPELAALAPQGDRRMSANPHANGGGPPRATSSCRTSARTPWTCQQPGDDVERGDPGARRIPARRHRENPENFRLFGPDETASNRLGDVFSATERQWEAELLPTDDHLAREGRVVEVLSEHLCQGWLEGYLLTGRHGLFNCYEAFIHIIDSMFNQHAKWLKVTRDIPWRRPIASLNYLLSSHVWRQDHNGFSHQDPGFIDHVVNKKAEVDPRLPAAGRELPAVGRRPLPAQPQLRQRDRRRQAAGPRLPDAWTRRSSTARAGSASGTGPSNDAGGEPDVVLGCCGDVPTLETLAAARSCAPHLPDLKVRVVNVVDLMRLQPDTEHPHGLSDHEFDALFTADKPVIFAYHGYPWLIHRLTYRRAGHANLHVRGYKEEGTTTTPFDMVMLNDLDRYPPGDGRDRPRARPGGKRRTRASANAGRPARRTRLHPRTRRGRPGDHQLGVVGGLSVLVVNAGSRSLKLHLVSAGDVAARVDSLDSVEPSQVTAIAHRIVHGGPRFRDPVVIDAQVREQIMELAELAPLHNPPALAAVGQAEQRFPGLPQVAVFDTGFHASIPPEASTYAVPKEWREDWGIRRYGFHGLSVQWAAGQVPVPRLVVCHLGGGCSVTAVHDGRSVDTTMGFSPLDGVPMATRSGSVDPGALLYLLRTRGADAAALEHTLNFESGLKALGGGSGDMRDLEGAVRAGRPAAELALAVFVHRVAGAVAAMATAAGGLDALVFTAGIGEGSALVRGRVCERLGFLGVRFEPALNAGAEPDCDIAATGSSVRVHVIRAREELVAARAVRELLGA